jgi:hypothetical protein
MTFDDYIEFTKAADIKPVMAGKTA